jgi:hypothetical protein
MARPRHWDLAELDNMVVTLSQYHRLYNTLETGKLERDGLASLYDPLDMQFACLYA